MKINKDMRIGEVVSKYPRTVEIFMNRGLHCFGCGGAAFESVEDGAKAHGMDDKEIKELINELNKAVKE